MGTHSLLNTNNMPAAAAPKAKKAPAAHPKYSVMIAAAITALKDRTGSSRAAILKHVVANNKVDAAKAATQVRLTLKMASAKGKNAGSYKLVKVVKPKKVKKVVKKKAAKKPAAKKVAKKPAAKKARKPAAKKAAKKPVAKKAAPKKKPAAKKAPKKKAAPKKK